MKGNIGKIVALTKLFAGKTGGKMKQTKQIVAERAILPRFRFRVPIFFPTVPSPVPAPGSGSGSGSYP
jgi:hypothetical protein